MREVGREEGESKGGGKNGGKNGCSDFVILKWVSLGTLKVILNPSQHSHCGCG